MTNDRNEDLYRAFERVARARGDANCLQFMGRWSSYKEILGRIDRFASGLAGLGVRKGDRFALALPNSPDYLAFHLALAKLGAAAVPIPPREADMEELEFMLADSGSVGALTHEEFSHCFYGIPQRLGHFRTFLSVDHVPEEGRRLDEIEKGPEAPPSASPEDLATILYASRASGRPKGVRLQHRQILAACRSFQQVLEGGQDDVWLCPLPMTSIFGWVSTLVPLLAGAKLGMVPGIHPPARWLKLMGNLDATVFVGDPEVYSMLVGEAGTLDPILRWFAFNHIRAAVSGLSPLPASVREAFHRKFRKSVLEGYGLAEAGSLVTLNPPKAVKPGTLGPPLPGTALRVQDEDGKATPAGVEGEIMLKGPGVMEGYHAQPEQTAEVLSPEGWLATGDMGSLDADGFLLVEQRRWDLVVVRGTEAAPVQIEAVILSHPSVSEVIAVEAREADGTPSIHCFCVTRPGARLDPRDLRKHFAEKLDEEQQPKEVQLLSSLSQKTLQKELQGMLLTKAADLEARQEGYDRRIDPRIAEIQTSYVDTGSEAGGEVAMIRMLDLSEGGARFEGECKIAVGQTIELVIQMPLRTVHVRARIMRSTITSNAIQYGCQFEDIASDGRELLRSYIEPKLRSPEAKE